MKKLGGYTAIEWKEMIENNIVGNPSKEVIEFIKRFDKNMITEMYVPLYPIQNSIELVQKDINKVALIDADRFKYIVVHNIYYDLSNEGKSHSLELVEEKIDSCLKRYVFDHYKASSYVFCFSVPSNQVFRNLLTCEKEYKGNRKQKDDPYYYEQKFDDMAYVYKYIKNKQITITESNLEADDLISLLQNEYTFIHSIDKDMKQVSGFHYDEDKRELIEISSKESFWLLMSQTILGDNTDNIPGLKGCGPAFVKKLEHFEDSQLIQMVQDAFIKKHGVINGLDMFVEMYNLVSLKKPRGAYTFLKYSKHFDLINSLTKKLQNNE